MKAGWVARQFDDVLEIRNGKNQREVESKDGEYPIFGSAGNVMGYATSYICEAGTTIIGRKGNINTPIFSETKFWNVDTAFGLTAKPSLDSKFLYYYCLSFDFGALNRGTTIPSLVKSELLRISIPLPPLAEQKRIVTLLDEAFAHIATAKANAEQNLQNARALFDSHLQSVFAQHGSMWRLAKLGDLTKLARGHNPPKHKFSYISKPGYVRFYQIRDGSSDDYVVYVPDTPQLHKVGKDDIMMVAYRHVGRVFRGVEGAFNVALCKISNARRDLLDDEYLFQIMPSQFVKGELLKRSERSLIPSMSIEHLREIQIPLPPLKEQQRVVETITALSTQTQRLESIYQQKLSALDALKKSLLHQAFSGQL